ncbi:MAG: DUF4268 domain-containing protein [Candidatus Delongbacteria bacterium]|jgi:hypothetical protein|nr:DUF4268 domain-containing protein [Candidatus Delongbacteria bacterium]
MYQINKIQNKITKLKECTFSELKFKEREHLQEWLADNPESLGEELLIIQKEFDGFNDTKERLDLLALDKQGNLVIIENKLDDSGKDVTWQVIKYASYCSSLTKDNIRDIYQLYLDKYYDGKQAEELLTEFFDDQEYEELTLNLRATQRLIMVAGKFRKEVTSTVLWLMIYGIRAQCFKVTPFALDEKLFLNIEQILPVKDTEDYSISMANKAKEEIKTQENLKNRYNIRTEFWKEYLQASNSTHDLYENSSTTQSRWLRKSMGMPGLSLNLIVSGKNAQSTIYVNRGDKEENEKFFDFLYKMKDKIETAFGNELIWDRKDDKVTCSIKYELSGVNVFDKDDWSKMIKFLVDASERMYKAFKNPVKKLNEWAKSN